MINTILFDLDGTLIQTPDLIKDTFKEIFETYIKDVKLSQEDYDSFLGQPLFDTFKAYNCSEEEVKVLVDIYRKKSEERISKGLLAYPMAEQTLKYLKKKGIHVGVVTSKLKDVAYRHLDITGLRSYIDVLIGYDDVTHHKPHAEPILKALEYFGVKDEQVVYVGDHENDIKAAKNANVLACAVTYSNRLEQMLALNPEFVIDSLEHIKDLV